VQNLVLRLTLAQEELLEDWKVQEIDGKTELLDSDQIGHHIRSERSESVFASIEGCQHRGLPT